MIFPCLLFKGLHREKASILESCLHSDLVISQVKLPTRSNLPGFNAMQLKFLRTNQSRRTSIWNKVGVDKMNRKSEFGHLPSSKTETFDCLLETFRWLITIAPSNVVVDFSPSFELCNGSKSNGDNYDNDNDYYLHRKQ